jgi:isopenicillin N synthase-like dioxygenase
MTETSSVPLIDITPLRSGGDVSAVARAIDTACRDTGFFCISGHGINPALVDALDASAREFFALPDAVKAEIAMSNGGRAWRGWFPLGGEVTSGVPDRKEGIYFGQELGDDDARVRAGRALHGPNLFPMQVPTLTPLVLGWLDALTDLGHIVMSGIALGLGLERDWFRTNLTADPTVLFRIFRYPVDGPGDWGVAQHTDYGLLTLLAQDDCGGLEVKSRNGWVDVEPVPNTFVCNIGDMLERMTGGRYRSTLHRVCNTSGRERLSFPFFFDPSWEATVQPLPLATEPVNDVLNDGIDRWDGRSVFEFEGTYGEYLVGKVSKVFPDLVHVI